jgi:hypothetical protein
MMERMELDSIPEDVRPFLSKSFKDVRDEPAQGDYYVSSLKTIPASLEL